MPVARGKREHKRKRRMNPGLRNSAPVYKKNGYLNDTRSFYKLQKMGLEPTPTCVDMNLNHARMPIPPLLQTLKFYHHGRRLSISLFFS